MGVIRVEGDDQVVRCTEADAAGGIQVGACPLLPPLQLVDLLGGGLAAGVAASPVSFQHDGAAGVPLGPLGLPTCRDGVDALVATQGVWEVRPVVRRNGVRFMHPPSGGLVTCSLHGSRSRGNGYCGLTGFTSQPGIGHSAGGFLVAFRTSEAVGGNKPPNPPVYRALVGLWHPFWVCQYPPCETHQRPQRLGGFITGHSKGMVFRVPPRACRRTGYRPGAWH